MYYTVEIWKIDDGKEMARFDTVVEATECYVEQAKLNAVRQVRMSLVLSEFTK